MVICGIFVSGVFVHPVFHSTSERPPTSERAPSISLLVYLFIWGLTSLSTLYRSYHDG